MNQKCFLLSNSLPGVKQSRYRGGTWWQGGLRKTQLTNFNHYLHSFVDLFNSTMVLIRGLGQSIRRLVKTKLSIRGGPTALKCSPSSGSLPISMECSHVPPVSNSIYNIINGLFGNHMLFWGVGELHNIFGCFYKIPKLLLSRLFHPSHSLSICWNYELRSRKHSIPVGLPSAPLMNWTLKTY